MKKIGIVGGLGWQSTVQYYSEICRRAEEWHLAKKLTGSPSTPEMTIESLNAAKIFSLVGNDSDEQSWGEFDGYLRAALRRVEGSEAEVALIASNAPHHRFEEIVRGVGVPVISILDATAQECARIGARHVLVLGTSLVMRSASFRAAFARYGIDLAGPRDEGARAATTALIESLQRGRVKGAATRLGRIAAASWLFGGEPVVCLARTELSQAFPLSRPKPSFRYGGVTYISSMAAHIEAVLKAVGIE